MTSSKSFRRRGRRAGCLLLGAAALCLAAPALHADPITYDLTLSPTLGQYGGIGTLTVESAPSSSGLTVYTAANHMLDNLTFTLDGQTFTLAGDPYASVEFLNGTLYNISFAQTVGSSPNRFTLDTSGYYAFYSNNGFTESAGTFVAVPVISPGNGSDSSNDSSATVPQTPVQAPTPEPGSLILLGSALLILGALMVRRKGARHP